MRLRANEDTISRGRLRPCRVLVVPNYPTINSNSEVLAWCNVPNGTRSVLVIVRAALIVRYAPCATRATTHSPGRTLDADSRLVVRKRVRDSIRERDGVPGSPDFS